MARFLVGTALCTIGMAILSGAALLAFVQVYGRWGILWGSAIGLVCTGVVCVLSDLK